jgi:glycosyltransferase involved in cell wall biosynthesis
MLVRAVGRLREKLVVYYVVDNYVEFFDPGAIALRSIMARSHERLLRQANIVFAVSQRLQERCLRHNPCSFVVPNGVNYEMFQARLAQGEIPADMRRIARPIVGYVGAIQPDIDFPLLERMSTEHPEWSLVFVGPDELGGERSKLEALLARPNIHYLGCKPVAEVPLYIGNCDVCMMPHIADKSTVPDSDSIKLYEYLACGRPVVSIDTPSVRPFSPLVRIASDPSGFIRCVEQSLIEPPDLSDQRKAVASEHSWRRRVATLSELIAPRVSVGASGGRGRRSPSAVDSQP